jgi:hypothetical protein
MILFNHMAVLSGQDHLVFCISHLQKNKMPHHQLAKTGKGRAAG